MGFVTWNSAYETGHAKMDSEHQALIDAFNTLQTALVELKDKEEVSKALEILAQRTREHFQTENDLMERFAYPGEHEHKGIHGRLATQVDELCSRFEVGKTAMTPAVVSFLEAWLCDHIQGEDHRLAQFLKSRGNLG